MSETTNEFYDKFRKPGIRVNRELLETLKETKRRKFIEACGDRQWYQVESLPEYEYDAETGQGKALERTKVPPGEGNLVSSRTDRVQKTWSKTTLKEQQIHRPVIDIDVPIRVVPSSTPGHSHLYIDVDVPEDTYFAMLDAMVEAEIVEPGFGRLSRIRQATFLRPPWVKKGR